MNKGRHHIDEEVVIRYITGNTSKQESIDVQDWINASASNRQVYEKLRKLWSGADAAEKVAPAEVDVDRAWNTLKGRIRDYQAIQQKHAGKSRSIGFYLTRVAAVLVIGLIVYTVFRYQSDQIQQVQLASTGTTITDSPLPDGTIISLNQHTKIEYPQEFEGDERRVKMEGEAYFQVQADTAKPFIIEANEAVIQVLGTSFNVKAHAEDRAVEVLVEEGLVQLSNRDYSQLTRLSVGEKGIYLKETDQVKKETDFDAEALYWLNKTLLFRDTDLSNVFKTLERLYEVEIVTDNDAILKCRLTAKFSNETIDHIIEHISTIFELEIEKEANKIVIRGNGCQ